MMMKRTRPVTTKRPGDQRFPQELGIKNPSSPKPAAPFYLGFNDFGFPERTFGKQSRMSRPPLPCAEYGAVLLLEFAFCGMLLKQPPGSFLLRYAGPSRTGLPVEA